MNYRLYINDFLETSRHYLYEVLADLHDNHRRIAETGKARVERNGRVIIRVDLDGDIRP